MEKNSYGQYSTTFSLKNFAQRVYRWSLLANHNEAKEEFREQEEDEQLLDMLKSQLKTLHFVFESDSTLRLDRSWSVVQAQNCLCQAKNGQVLGKLKQINERNMEAEIEEMLAPLQKYVRTSKSDESRKPRGSDPSFSKMGV